MKYITSQAGSFFLILTILVSHVQLEGLQCWTCDGANASPLCDPGESLAKGHKGSSEPCPPAGVSADDDEHAKWGCFIMETVVQNTGRTEVAKGCVRFKSLFTTNGNGDVLQVDDCYEHVNSELKREVFFHDVAICICNSTDNCNKETMPLSKTDKDGNLMEVRHIGFGDIEKKLKVGEKSGGVIYTVVFSAFCIHFWILILNLVCAFL